MGLILVKNVLRKVKNLVGNPLNSFLEAVRFILTQYEPVGSRGVSKCYDFYDF